MKRSTSRRKQPQQPPPTPQFSAVSHHRDSDASFASSRLSISSNHHQHPARQQPITDNSYKQMAIRAVNSFLSSHSFPICVSLKPVPSNKDLTDVIKFLLSLLDFDVSNLSKLEDDLVYVLKYFNCPHKVNKSAFRSLGAPHSFPLVLAVIHWLVQLVLFTDFHFDDRNNTIMAYSMDSYVAYMKGDDEAVEVFDKEFSDKMEDERGILEDNLNLMDEEAKNLEEELNALKSMPSEWETFESQRKDLEMDVDKFQGFIASLQDANSVTVKALEDKEMELAAKVEEIRRTKAENEELKKRVEAQGINMRDAERMKRELLAVEREISEAESSRSSWEEKCWDLDTTIGQKLKELEALSIECNQALRRLKLVGDYQYALNAKGSTPAEVLGINYKSTLKPAFNAFAEDIKKNTTAKFEEFIALQQQSKEMTAKIEAKRNRLAVLESHIDERERQLERIRTEINEYSFQCANEAEKIVANVEAEAHNLSILESETLDTLKVAELKLREETKQNEEETQRCAFELFALIDSVSKYKEHVENNISEMRKDLSETTEYISIAYKNSLSSQFNISLDARHPTSIG